MIKKILVVEDDAAIRETLAELLRQEGFNVDSATNGKEAITYLTRYNSEPCLILLDLMMPVADGWHLIEYFQKHPVEQTLPIVILTATSKCTDSNKPKGVLQVIKKPVDLDTVINTVRKYCA